MKIVFMGTPDFAVTSLQKLLDSENEVIAVVTVPDKAQGRGLKIRSSAVKKLALQHNIEVLQPDKLNDPQFISRLEELSADLFVVVAFRILPRSVFSIPPSGTINVHASLLPKYRGAAPINWAIINGDKETGVTTMLIDDKVDTGNILFQRKVDIEAQMTAGELHDVLAEQGADLLDETIVQLAQGKVQPVQQDTDLATKAPKLTKKSGHLNFDLPAVEVFNRIRGLSPYPAAYFYHYGRQIKVFKAGLRAEEYEPCKAGQVCSVTKELFTICCAEGAIDIYEVQLEGKKRQSVQSFFNGYKMEAGEQLT